MKILKIENNIGCFSVNGVEYKNIYEITRNDIFGILTSILENADDETNFDRISEENVILNDAQKIIYEKIYYKLIATKSKREEILNSVNQEVAPLLSKYNISLEE